MVHCKYVILGTVIFCLNVVFSRTTFSPCHRDTFSNNTPISPITSMYTIYTTSASFSGMQLISTVESFHTSPFQILV